MVATYGFPVAAVEGEGDADLVAVVARDLEIVQAPAGVADVDRDPSIVPTLLVLNPGALKQQAVKFITR